jgi:hypothetical protein
MPLPDELVVLGEYALVVAERRLLPCGRPRRVRFGGGLLLGKPENQPGNERGPRRYRLVQEGELEASDEFVKANSPLLLGGTG